MKKRSSWDEYFMKLAVLTSERSTCERAHVGAIVVSKKKRIIATGYNGSVGAKTPHCDDVGHVMRDGHCIATMHAEMNCISYAAREGISLEGASIYCTHFPCLNCTKLIIQSGIDEVIYYRSYRVDEYATELLKINGVHVRQYELEEEICNE